MTEPRSCGPARSRLLPDVHDLLVEALGDRDDTARSAAKVGIGDQLDDAMTAVTAVTEPLLHDSNSFVRSRALEYYATLGASDLRDRRAEALDDPDAYVRSQAILELRDHLDASLIPVFEPLLSDCGGSYAGSAAATTSTPRSASRRPPRSKRWR